MLTSLATRAASASPGAASASAARDRRQAITVAGMMQKDDGDLDEDDFLWEKLPGRCCFYGYEDPKDASRWIGAKTCEECSVWSEPDNYCHTSRDACEECGMRLPPKKPKKGAEPPPPKNGGARSGRRKGKDAQAECERLFRGRDDATDITDATSAADDYPGARAIGRGPPPSLAPSAGPPKLRMDDERRGGAADDASRARRQLLD